MLYSLVAFFAFILMPFMYFYYEERDEDVTTGQVRTITLGRLPDYLQFPREKVWLRCSTFIL